MKTARAAAVLTWIYAAAFGLPGASLGPYCSRRRGPPSVSGAAAGHGCRHGHRSPHGVDLR
jgi:hypothetical protein